MFLSFLTSKYQNSDRLKFIVPCFSIILVLFFNCILIFLCTYNFIWDHRGFRSTGPCNDSALSACAKRPARGIMQLSIEAIVFHRGDGGVEAQKFNLLDRARFNTIPQLGEPCEKRLGRFKIVRKLRSGPCATCKKRSPPLPPSRRGENTATPSPPRAIGWVI